MRKSLLSLIVAGLMSGTASAHIGDNIYLVYEIADADVADLDYTDISVADWEDVVGDPSLIATDFYADPTVGEGGGDHVTSRTIPWSQVAKRHALSSGRLRQASVTMTNRNRVLPSREDRFIKTAKR